MKSHEDSLKFNNSDIILDSKIPKKIKPKKKFDEDVIHSYTDEKLKEFIEYKFIDEYVNEKKEEVRKIIIMFKHPNLVINAMTVKEFFLPVYKEIKDKTDSETGVVPTWMRELGEYNKEATAGLDFVDDLKTDFFGDRVFVFTPKGDVIDLPRGSNSIDFAYTVHSELGNKLSGSKINGKLTSLETPLENGDIVEVISKSSSHPSAKWYDLAKTALAKKQIRSALGLENKSGGQN